MMKKKWVRPKLIVLVRGGDANLCVLSACKTGAVTHEVWYDSWMCFGAWVTPGVRGDTCYWDDSFAARKCLIMGCDGRKVEGPCEPVHTGWPGACPTGCIYQTCPGRTIASS